MPADPIHPDQLHGEAGFRADLVAYLDSLPVGELAELLGKLPLSRQQPLGLGVLMVVLNERLPDGYKLLPPAATPAQARGAGARCVRWWPTGVPPAPAATLMGQRRGWPSGWPTADSRPTSTPTGPGRAQWASGGRPRRYAPRRPTPARPTAARSPATHQPPDRSHRWLDEERERDNDCDHR
jgi:hypothetical protein